MADKKVTALTDLGDNIASADLFHVVDDPSGTPINKKIAAEDVFNNIPSFLGLKQTSQSITADGSTATAVNVTTAITTIIDTATSGTNAITITPTNLRGYTTITLNAPGETVTCLFKNSNWNVIAGNGYVLA